MSLTQAIKRQACKLGFELVGVAPVKSYPELASYKEWLDAGYAGEMVYLERNSEKKADISLIIPNACSVIVCGKIYHTDYPLSIDRQDLGQGWISRYGWGDDYHDIIQKKLFKLIDFVRSATNAEIIGRAYVDTGPVVDRIYAKYGGIGWFGKNTCIINQQKGSWFFLGEIITDLKLDYDTPVADRCGSCEKCIELCPTGAILAPYVLDSKLCISYLTIELKGSIPVAERDKIGNHIFGCDICQDVCPWNRKAKKTTDEQFAPRPDMFNPKLGELASWDAEEFRHRFRRSPVKRTKYQGFKRNIAVAMGNSGKEEFLPALEHLAGNQETLVAEHAHWAIEKIKNTSR